MFQNLVFPIEGVVQKYAWGKKGKSSEVACLYEKSSENFELEKDVAYAEVLCYLIKIFSYAMIGINFTALAGHPCEGSIEGLCHWRRTEFVSEKLD